jgi:hypothetical protein
VFPTGSERVVIANPTTVNAIEAFALDLRVEESVALTLTDLDPSLVGVPDTTPDADSVRPAGSFPVHE